jgi:hypothetical protein
MDGMSYHGEEPVNLDQLRERLRKMTEEELIRFGKAARSMCRDKPPRQVFVIQLDEARAEWRRRNPKPSFRATKAPME